MKALKDNQQKAIKKLSKYKVGALFMEAGDGKTRTTLELIKSTDVDYILWLTPFQTKENLQNEINKWNNKLNIEIVGIETLSLSDKTYLDIYTKVQKNNTFIVCDESLKIKNHTAKRTKRIIELGRMCDYKLILNGTPLSRNLLDIWAQFDFLSGKILNMGIAEFKNTFCEYTKITIKGRSKEYIKKYYNVDYLYKMIEPYVFESNLDLMTKIQYINIDYNLSEEEKQQHDYFKTKYLDVEWLMMKPNIFLELTQKMQHNYSLSEEKIHIVKDLEKQYGKILIVAKYFQTQEKLKELFPNQKILSWQKHSLGLNLQEYNVIVKFDKHWDWALHEQLEHRIYRTGQEKDCIIIDLTGNVGLEKLINENISKKQKLLTYFKNYSNKQQLIKEL